jgi:glycosyltransferase involved in cell wall biosynthesis
MHILVTTDTVGGVWSYTRELVTGLVARGIRVTLVSFGGVPSRAQRAWMAGLHGVRYYPTGFRLEWMQDSEEDVSDSARYLLRVIGECKPDLLHLSQYCFGAIEVGLPKLMVAHSDVMSWSQEVRGEEPRDAWAEWYRGIVERGVAGATTLVAPSRWMLDHFEGCYGRHRRSCVIYNGRTPALFNPTAGKQSFAASAGRLWDEGKQTRLLLRLDAPLPIHLVGSTSLAGDSSVVPVGAEENASNVRFEGQLDETGMCELLSRAAIYIAPSRYEPFGLAPLEAALSRCAIVANDIPSFQEVWGDAAVYFRRDDVGSLREVLARLQENPSMLTEYANRAHGRALERYSAERMVDEYMQLYSALLEQRASAA